MTGPVGRRKNGTRAFRQRNESTPWLLNLLSLPNLAKYGQAYRTICVVLHGRI